jgi:hypothetical protein
MPVYEIVMQDPSGMRRVHYSEHVQAEIGDALTIDGDVWVVTAKEPPFERRRIERLTCMPNMRKEVGSQRHRRPTLADPYNPAAP